MIAITVTELYESTPLENMFLVQIVHQTTRPGLRSSPPSGPAFTMESVFSAVTRAGTGCLSQRGTVNTNSSQNYLLYPNLPGHSEKSRVVHPRLAVIAYNNLSEFSLTYAAPAYLEQQIFRSILIHPDVQVISSQNAMLPRTTVCTTEQHVLSKNWVHLLDLSVSIWKLDSQT
ncbi:hypothetical protein BDU57DRAFT_204793 [Ampelomyces quisqualis]|uniref:Uncharacterized protein n=1 Tax=Ampelomyces quisqualis TaxID=50730 RepID=A0A6A5QK43_AMPQU|nr:hypothetical protein BDU57DRAFT_204793 [Ampelomyces quisqualis]